MLCNPSLRNKACSALPAGPTHRAVDSTVVKPAASKRHHLSAPCHPGCAGRDRTAAATGPVQAAAGALHRGGGHRCGRPQEGVLPAAAGGAAVPRLRHAHLPAGVSCTKSTALSAMTGGHAWPLRHVRELWHPGVDLCPSSRSSRCLQARLPVVFDTGCRSLEHIGSTLRPWRATPSSCCWASSPAWRSIMVRNLRVERCAPLPPHTSQSAA